tara:strand:- start:374 stop:940 length:567 start_codon:yes stop_codon:yes gene_type:complete
MAFKINISHKGKTYKVETESETLVGTNIGDKINGKDVSEELSDYELEITGTSDKAGFPGFKNLKGSNLRKVLVTYGPGMKNRPKKEGKKPTPNNKGLKLRKTFRGSEISSSTIQINIKVLKEGPKKFDTLVKPKEGEGEAPSEAPEEKPKPATEESAKGGIENTEQEKGGHVEEAPKKETPAEPEQSQ